MSRQADIRKKAIRSKFEELKYNWHVDNPIDVKAGDNTGKVNINFEFVAYLMRGIRSHLPWSTYKLDPANPPRFVDDLFLKGGCVCQQYVIVMAEMISYLNMPVLFINFSEDGAGVGSEFSHWGIEVELVNDQWAFYDPTYCFCARDPLPLGTGELKKRPDILKTWHENFGQYRNSFDEERSVPAHFERHIDYFLPYTCFFKKTDSECLEVQRSKAYLESMGRSIKGYMNQGNFLKI